MFAAAVVDVIIIVVVVVVAVAGSFNAMTANNVVILPNVGKFNFVSL